MIKSEETEFSVPESNIFNDIEGGSEEEEEEDTIIREIPVFISGQMDSNLNLIQWPLTPSNNPNSAMFMQSIDAESGQRVRNTMPMVPDNARVKVKNKLMELDYSFTNSMQIYESNAPIEPKTHLAIGRWDKDGQSIHLTPLSHIYQVRPSFRDFV